MKDNRKGEEGEKKIEEHPAFSGFFALAVLYTHF
jgi:hypothetical protein